MVEQAQAGVRRPERRAGLAAVDVDGETVVHDPCTGDVHHLNAPAAAVWALCDGEATVQGMARDIADAFDAPVDVVRRDVVAALARFERAGLLLTGCAPCG